MSVNGFIKGVTQFSGIKGIYRLCAPEGGRGPTCLEWEITRVSAVYEPITR